MLPLISLGFTCPLACHMSTLRHELTGWRTQHFVQLSSFSILYVRQNLDMLDKEQLLVSRIHGDWTHGVLLLQRLLRLS